LPLWRHRHQQLEIMAAFNYHDLPVTSDVHDYLQIMPVTRRSQCHDQIQA